jgi:biopolymer transport protein ExbD
MRALAILLGLCACSSSPESPAPRLEPHLVELPLSIDQPADEAAEPLTVAVRPNGTGYTIILLRGARESEHQLPADATGAQIAALLPPAEPNARALIAADGETRHAFVVAVIDALRSAGYTRYALSVNPAE